MSKPFKFRYVNEIVGGFVLAVLAILLVSIVLAGRAQGWFQPDFKLHVRFPPDGSAGIKKGAEVEILGTQVGRVDEIRVADDGSMEGVLLIGSSFQRFVRADSEAILKKKFGVAGDAFVEITRGTGAMIEGNMLPAPARKDTEIVEMLQQMVKQIQQEVVPLIEQYRKMGAEFTGLAADLRAPDGNLQKLVGRLDSIAAGLDSGRGTAGQLLTDKAVYNGVNEAVRTLNEVLVELKSVMKQVDAATGQLPGVMTQSQDTLREAEVLIDGIQKHWAVRKYVEQRPAEVSPEPAAVPIGASVQ